MPIYEYLCENCEETFEEWTLRADDKTVKPCPECGKDSSRLISNTSFSLKGEGWYATEYGSLKNRNSKDEHSAVKEADKNAAGTSVSSESSSAPSSTSSTASTASSQPSA